MPGICSVECSQCLVRAVMYVCMAPRGTQSIRYPVSFQARNRHPRSLSPIQPWHGLHTAPSSEAQKLSLLHSNIRFTLRRWWHPTPFPTAAVAPGGSPAYSYSTYIHMSLHRSSLSLSLHRLSYGRRRPPGAHSERLAPTARSSRKSLLPAHGQERMAVEEAVAVVLPRNNCRPGVEVRIKFPRTRTAQHIVPPHAHHTHTTPLARSLAHATPDASQPPPRTAAKSQSLFSFSCLLYF
ncbi:hypothetical protein EDC01DRAFT_404138 [Geopyxis carbonaria]|nr:hypothetical protein EDC01DRAFT_404138 [Geopyxis carbonaria]